MEVLGFNISLRREPEGVVKKGPPSRSYGGQGATEYALSSGWWPEDARTGTLRSNAYQQVVWVYRAVNALAEQVMLESRGVWRGSETRYLVCKEDWLRQWNTVSVCRQAGAFCGAA